MGSDGRLQLKCTADGVPFVVATASCQLSSLNYLEGIDNEIARQFVSDFKCESDFGYHLLIFQVTKFSCVRFAVGMSFAHSVCVGVGAAQFCRALTELASGKSEPPIKPVWERERLVGIPTQEPFHFLVDKSSLATSPYLPTSDIVREYFNVTAHGIEKLKISMMEGSGKWCCTGKIHHNGGPRAYVWRSRFIALKLDANGNCSLHVAVGIRRLLDPPLADGYYGNAFIFAYINLQIYGLFCW
ncbi:hypothetical protein SLEP1_g54043 [Rubroshorea leprosula]|uniref:Uncharacterized protein n=1 Tax=Rubroshorea leprosula TaxID=152421 RepID=A0AAV5MBL5_9ROSI|nr:hypothetical protein SLEP1_g54043 [Rubroshorea leprosula]